jgi:small neutral amino acid transporter SnatA (MarC family)
MKNILLAFIPVFVAVDPIGVLPIYISITGHERGGTAASSCSRC